MGKKILAEEECEKDETKLSVLTGPELQKHLELVNSWDNVEEKHILKRFKFPDFLNGVRFVDKIAEVAEQEQHHPRICVDMGEVIIILATHSPKGLTKNDFIIAAKIDRLAK